MYIDPNPGSKIGRLRDALMYLYEEHRAAGTLPTSVRFLFYELVSRSIIEKGGDRPDKIVSEALTNLRERGLVPWGDIVDETRALDDYTGSTTVADDWLSYLNSARIDPWHGHAPLILTESRSLAGVLRGLSGTTAPASRRRTAKSAVSCTPTSRRVCRWVIASATSVTLISPAATSRAIRAA
jgi:hypothetical protein